MVKVKVKVQVKVGGLRHRAEVKIGGLKGNPDVNRCQGILSAALNAVRRAMRIIFWNPFWNKAAASGFSPVIDFTAVIFQQQLNTKNRN